MPGDWRERKKNEKKKDEEKEREKKKETGRYLDTVPSIGPGFFLAGAGGPVCSRKVRNVTHFWRAAKVEGESQIFQETRFRITLRAYSTRECSTSY